MLRQDLRFAATCSRSSCAKARGTAGELGAGPPRDRRRSADGAARRV